MGKASDKLFEIADRPAATEHAIQSAYFAALAMMTRDLNEPRLTWVHAIPNGGVRDAVTGALMKAEGVKRGVADVCLPFPCGNHPFAYLEFKRPCHRDEPDGGLSADQIVFRDFVVSQGAFYRVVYTWREARDATLAYLTLSAVHR